MDEPTRRWNHTVMSRTASRLCEVAAQVRKFAAAGCSGASQWAPLPRQRARSATGAVIGPSSHFHHGDERFHPGCCRRSQAFARNSQLWQVCGEASRREEILPKVSELRPEVILLDLSMATRDGASVVETLKKSNPGLLIVLMSEQHVAIMQRLARSLGARGVAKSRLAFELVPLLNSLRAEIVGKRESV